MPGFAISRDDAQRCNDLVTIAGLPHDLSPEFEAHFSSNRKIVAVYRNLVFEVGNIQYFDSPEGDILFAEPTSPDSYAAGRIIAPKRRMQWGQRFLGLPEGMPLDGQVIDFLMHDGFNNGLPIGIVPGDQTRLAELLILGDVAKGPYCGIMDYKGQGEVRIYDALGKISGSLEELPYM